ncbi:hypothetical protein TI39_contig354g00158 [Zymoseptoria brevis]|uniref:Uncharacterized protein n=1 Tax=Zymoseptoria brevis TaxID=1047168 RepID=A0A0F4GQ48_9PEZI|nr:hypothetical protein TI39_contig354g00158 [Zymoseptoria brevis]
MPRIARGPRHRFLNDHRQDLQELRIGSAGISRSHEDEYDDEDDDDDDDDDDDNASNGGYDDGFQQHDDWEDYDDRKDGWEDVRKNWMPKWSKTCVSRFNAAKSGSTTQQYIHILVRSPPDRLNSISSTVFTPAYFDPPHLQPSHRAGLVSANYNLPSRDTFSHPQLSSPLASLTLHPFPTLHTLESHSTSMSPYTQHTRNHHHRACTCGCQARAPCRSAPWYNTSNRHHVAMRSPPLQQHDSSVGSSGAWASPEPCSPGEGWRPFRDRQPQPECDAGRPVLEGYNGSSDDGDEDIEMDLDVSVVDLDGDELIGGNGWNWGDDWIWAFDEHEINDMDEEMSEADSLGYIDGESIDEGYDGDDEREWDEWWKASR